ncbi:MAG TPA: ABC transporter permease [Candidatus Saccharimonadales bacterium]
MIGFIDTLILVHAKLHAKRVLLFTAIAISGLLFAVIYGSIIVFDGATKSANEYTKTALDGKYLVKSTPTLPQGIFGPNRIDVPDSVVNELNALQADYTAKQKQLATELKLPFDEKAIEPILVPNPYITNDSGKKRLMINAESPVFQIYLQNLQQSYVEVAKNKLADLKDVAKPYNATAFHQNAQAVTSFQTMRYLEDGKENIASLREPNPSNSDFSTYGYLTSSVRNSTYSFVDDSLIRRFILPKNEQRNENKTAVPVVITAKEAVDLFGKQLGISEKPERAEDQIKWMKKLQEKVNGHTYATCYRNQADIARVTQAAQTLTEIEQHKNDKTYVKPTLVYNLPTEVCGDISVKQDSRSIVEKNATAKQEEISKKLGTFEEPLRQLFHFQIVGIMPTTPQQTSITNLPSFLSDLLGAHYGAGAIVPRQLYDSLPQASQYSKILLDSTNGTYDLKSFRDAGIGEVIITFNSLDEARAFIKDQGCPTQDNCDKPFTLESYGSNYLLIDDFQALLTKLLSYALFTGMGVAAIIVWFMMTRIIIDSRRETAVFRAIGAKRRDIVSIYTLYSIVVALRIIVFAFIVGIGGALIVQLLFGAEATNYARASYGLFANVNDFKLISFTSPLFLWVTLSIIAISLIAVTPPLIRNVRRNPIKDMRDE